MSERDVENATAKPVKNGIAKRIPRGLAPLALAVLAPAVVLYGVFGLSDRRYLAVSLALIGLTMAAFFLRFERKKPKARELVLLSVLCAVTVVGRMLFFMLPQVKPVAALVILAGVVFGGETGFLVGAVGVFVSNFYFGQGPWTPWQMLGFGMIGLLAGLLFHHEGFFRRVHQKNGWLVQVIGLPLFGGVATVLVYGFLVNLGSVIMATGKVTWPSLLASCVAGLPMDAVHAFSTMVFLAVLSIPVIEILQRMKQKYGILA